MGEMENILKDLKVTNLPKFLSSPLSAFKFSLSTLNPLSIY